MNAHTEWQAVSPCSFFPSGEDIAMRSYIDRVPAMMPAVPKVKIVMMVAHSKKILRTSTLIKSHKSFRIPVVGFPLIYHIHKAEFRRMAVEFNMFTVGVASLFVHSSGIPVTCFRLTLRAPVRPYSEFCITEPFRRFMCGNRLPGRLKLTFCSRHTFCGSIIRRRHQQQ